MSEKISMDATLLELVISFVPGNVYWVDVNGIILGVNDTQAKHLGFKNRFEVAGKHMSEVCPPVIAQQFLDNNALVIQKNEISIFEEVGHWLNGEVIHYLTHKAPLKQNGKIIGIIGVSIDITDKKKKEQLAIELATQQSLIDAQRQDLKDAEQLAHDIRSPLAAIGMLSTLLPSEVNEKIRINIRESSNNAIQMADDFIDRKKERIKASGGEVAEDKSKAVLMTPLLLQIQSAKKTEYSKLPLTFEAHFDPETIFAFVKLEANGLKRSLSNLINNAVDAFEGKPGKVSLNLRSQPESITVTIEDNGKGIPPEILEKIRNNLSVTAGKSNGHGIGLTQVREMLQANQGTLSITSEVGEGTQVSIQFPRIPTPLWAAMAIELNSNDIILVLDDDSSIHGAWDMRFESLLKAHPSLSIKHFTQGSECLAFIQNLSTADQARVFLLSDYELLNQDMNGMDVIEKAGAQRSLLVTSHYAEAEVQQKAMEKGTKILAKDLAAEISIAVREALKIESGEKIIYLLEDDQMLAESLMMTLESKGVIVTHFTRPEDFITALPNLPKGGALLTDLNFNGSQLDGTHAIEAAGKAGFTRNYLFTGEAHIERPLPEQYLTRIIPKSAPPRVLMNILFPENIKD